jgi:hypothetical protein
MATIERVDDLAVPRGLVTVDLIDAGTGRVLRREEAENFLSLQSIRVAKWWQRMMWGAFCPVETADAYGSLPTEMPWFPAQHLGFWDDAAAESAGTEDRVAKELVGWASRHPVGSPSGKRGVVNISESAFQDASAKWVFDWATSQGNGTFQSVGWTRVDETTGFLIPRWPEDDGVLFTNLGTTAWNTVNNPLWWDTTASLWNLTEAIGTNLGYRVMSAALGGGATTSIVDIPNTHWRNENTSAPTFGHLNGIARIGTDFILCGYVYSGGNQPKLTRHTVAAAQTWTRVEPTLIGTRYSDCTIDGSANIWTAGTDGVMRRHSNADGTITASVTPVVAPTVLEGIAYDSTDGHFWVSGTVAGLAKQVWKVDSSGNTVAPAYSLRLAELTVVSTAPYAGTYYLPGAAAREPYTVQPYRNNAVTAAGSVIWRNPTRKPTSSLGPWCMGSPTTLAVHSGEPWVAGRSSTTDGLGGCSWASALRGGTLGTRALLGSPITKTSSQTLKITYQFNFS